MPSIFRFQFCLSVLFIILVCTAAYGQDYRAAVGVRFGYGWGVTAKGPVGNKKSGHVIEGMIRYGYHGVVFTQPGVNFAALYEKHFKFGRYQNWAFFIGGGPSLGIGKTSSVKIMTFGLGPILGFDVTAPRLPLNFSLDYKPSYYIDKTLQRKEIKHIFSYYEVGFSIRYAIK
jgi:hypothetical protein